MNNAQRKAQLVAILENSASTADFLQSVASAIETLYADAEQAPTEMVGKLYEAIDAAEIHEAEHA